VKVTIIKMVADGEQLSVEWPIPTDWIKLHQQGKMHLADSLRPAFDLIDARLMEMNKRIMAGNYLIQKLPPDAHFAVSNLMDVLHGKASGPAVEAILKERQAELEAAQARAEAAAQEEKARLAKLTQPVVMPPMPGENPARIKRRGRHPRKENVVEAPPLAGPNADIPGGV